MISVPKLADEQLQLLHRATPPGTPAFQISVVHDGRVYKLAYGPEGGPPPGVRDPVTRGSSNGFPV